MKTTFATLIAALVMLVSFQAKAETEIRELASFSEISLRIPAKVYLEQGKKQSVEIVAKSSTMEEIITEVKGRQLVIRFAAKNYLWKSFTLGKSKFSLPFPRLMQLPYPAPAILSTTDQSSPESLTYQLAGVVTSCSMT